MLIDPFVVVAQLINFGLLVWLLRRFLYGPIKRAMEEREARVLAETEEARRLHAEAVAEGQRYRALLSGFEAEREARISEIHLEVDELRKARIQEVRADVHAQRERWHNTLEQEKEAFLRELRLRVGQESLAAMRRAFTELADEELEGRMIDRFLERLRALDPADHQRLIASAAAGGEGFLLTTGFPLAEDLKDDLCRQISTALDANISVQFQTDVRTVSGVEIRAGGLKVSWTIDEYLHSLEQSVRDLLPDAAALPEADVAG